MSSENQPLDSLQDVRDIRKMMEKSSRFTSLSGLSCVAAGVCALVGAWAAHRMIINYYGDSKEWTYSGHSFAALKVNLLLLAGAVLAAALISAFYFTWRKAKQQGEVLDNYISRRVFWSMAVPLVAGSLYVFGMLQYDEWRFVGPGCLIFYGLALVNAGKYTVADIRYLGYCEVVLGLLNILFIGYSLYYWALGFGVLHIIYGSIMWWKYERVKVN
ncbi:MAG: hypothetical protein E6Q24_12680 [Chitinophagaceae bacterium]|jgi:hypothetical protein|nr:MAG: hypothetical protein E6Q24_12680 [Chitinophagaceae bacterium]